MQIRILGAPLSGPIKKMSLFMPLFFFGLTGCSLSGSEEPNYTMFQELDIGVEVPQSEIIGLTAADLDGDGRVDLIGTGTQLVVLKNEGNLNFSDMADDSGLTGIIGKPIQTGAAGDLNGDGHPDVLLAGQGYIYVFWNLGDGSFTLGPTWDGLESTCASLLLIDADYDGLTDIYAVMQAETDPDMRQDMYLRNKGDGTFESLLSDVLPNHGIGWAAAALDVDLDGYSDIYVANDSLVVDTGERPLQEEQTIVARPGTRDMLFANHSFLNNQPLTLVDVADDTTVSHMPRSNMGVIVADFNDDGLEDLYFSDYGKNDLFVAQGSGKYAEQTDEFGLGAAYQLTEDCPSAPLWSYSPCWLVSWGSVFTDFDRDGWQDLIVVNTQLFQKQPTLVWKGAGPGQYDFLENELGASQAIGMIAGDFDDDGDQELFWADGSIRGFEASQTQSCDWMRLQLEGNASNPDGLGATIHITFDDDTQLMRRIGTGGILHSWALPEAHFSWCDKEIIETRINWPSGYTQKATLLEPNKRHLIQEPLVVNLSSRTLPADGSSTVQVSVSPASESGLPLGEGATIELDSTVGTWLGDIEHTGNGIYERVLRAPDSPADAVLQIRINGQTLRLRPRVKFTP